jgi:hypothetical protein
MAYTLNMDVIIYDVYSTFARYYQHVDSLKKWLKILWLNARYWEMTALRRHTGIGYRFVEEEKDRKIIVNFNYIKH